MSASWVHWDNPFGWTHGPVSLTQEQGRFCLSIIAYEETHCL